jgi:hypothetical protein
VVSTSTKRNELGEGDGMFVLSLPRRVDRYLALWGPVESGVEVLYLVSTWPPGQGSKFRSYILQIYQQRYSESSYFTMWRITLGAYVCRSVR